MTVTLYTAPTPNLVLDYIKLERNIAAMAAIARQQGVSLRPHLKTPKSRPVADMMARAGATSFTTSTLQEAERLSGAHIDDLFYAIPLEASKVSRCAQLISRGTAMTFLIDTIEAAMSCNTAAIQEQVQLPLWIEIDVDGYRTGIDPQSNEFIDLALFIEKSAGLKIAGLMSYGGRSYGCDDRAGMAMIASMHRSALLSAKQRLADIGVPVPRLSFGSGPAVVAAQTLEGIDEVRCGIYAFQDLFQAGIGMCGVSDIALSVLTTVISRQASRNRIIIDAGGLALSKDRSTQGREFDAGFGLICDVDGMLIEDIYVQAVSQELGIVTTRSGSALDMDSFPIGTRLRVLPNHADMTAAGYESYLVVRANTNVEDVWSRANGW
jgi:D-serine deaminase-like pyridoxal phosphate-dependent protein